MRESTRDWIKEWDDSLMVMNLTFISGMGELIIEKVPKWAFNPQAGKWTCILHIQNFHELLMCINDSFLVDDLPPTTCVRSIQFSSFNAFERLTLGELECSNLRETVFCCCYSNRLLSFICYSQIFLWFVSVDWGDVIVVEQTVDWMKRGKNVTSFFCSFSFSSFPHSLWFFRFCCCSPHSPPVLCIFHLILF